MNQFASSARLLLLLLLLLLVVVVVVISGDASYFAQSIAAFTHVTATWTPKVYR
jgi:hypothetical protein